MQSNGEFTRRRLVSASGVLATSILVGSCAGVQPASVGIRRVAAQPPGAPTRAEAPRPPAVVEEALAALAVHARRFVRQDRIGVADFTHPSSEPRFHIVHVERGQIERSLLVAHGSGSDPGHTGRLQRFSNQLGSNATSRGAYLTAGSYVGKYGRSERLIGLDGDNNMALDRAIVVHGAPYVDPGLITAQGRIGRSQGCFAFQHSEVASVMDLLGEGRMIYATRLA
jgi:hypothetical protein